MKLSQINIHDETFPNIYSICHRNVIYSVFYNPVLCDYTYCYNIQRGDSTQGKRQHTILKHTEDRPFECNQCEHKFKLECSLKKHQFLHTGIRPHVCSVCGKEFKKPTHLKTHMKIHDKVYHAYCELCNKRFVQKYNYILHMRNHHPEKTSQYDSAIVDLTGILERTQ